MYLGLDIGSTTIKYVLLNDNEEIIYKDYKRHYSHIKENVIEILNDLKSKGLLDDNIKFAISGSAGMGLANGCEIPFIQEVYATRVAAKRKIPDTDVIIELGGEDAKILFLSDSMEVRMNGSCAGGTGAFIDQMATLLNVDITEINGIASDHEKLYSIASRCGVFAKTDIQPLLNQGASKSDIAASIFKAVVNQTIAGLAQGRVIEGNVAYLGGPLTFLDELRKSFDESLGLNGICPENSLYFVALGTAFCATKSFDTDRLINTISYYKSSESYSFNDPLFKNQAELENFRRRHSEDNVKSYPLDNYTKPLFLGVDSGSTTLKMVLVDENLNIRYSRYMSNQGNPVEIFRTVLEEIYTEHPYINIKGAASTGYGEDLMKNAFMLDGGLVETMAHFRAAKHFMPNVDFIIDIGGQDIKCFKIEHGVISNIFLNEACSSGCGSFLQTFANALGYPIEEFAKMGLLAPKPVDLGSRCTVFMNSSVKQAQKDGATIDNISAGLSISVVKNALYKVIRATNVEELGKNIVVQGGTFHNEAVLRAFERELNLNVVCPNIAGLMGAYGAALYAKDMNLSHSTIISKDEINLFKHETRVVNCGLCENHCALSINTFGTNSNKFISGNRCERPIKSRNAHDNKNLNIYHVIREKLMSYKPKEGKRGKISLPLVLNNYELLPFWHTFFTELGFEVNNSGFSDSKLFIRGTRTIPSDTICYPAKLVHGHIDRLITNGEKTIFYPCMSYNIDEGKGDNHYNCPVVAYYPQNIANNISFESDVKFIYDFIGIHNKVLFEKNIYKVLSKYFKGISKKEIHNASLLAYEEYEAYKTFIVEKGQEIIHESRMNGLPIIVLAGRPYHMDPEVNHGIDNLIQSFGAGIINEYALAMSSAQIKTNVLNQWTYHARLYEAANAIKDNDDMNLVQLVSFGCGLDAITTDEIKDILEHNGKIYTQIKIDEITNLGAVRIRLRSLFEALKQKKED